MIINSVLFGFIFSLFCVNHVHEIRRELSTRVFSACKFEGNSASRNWVSSAYITTFPYGMCCGRSFVKTRNNRGPKIDPWTTPWVTSSARDPPLTVCVRPRSQAANQSRRTPYHSSLSRRRPCSMLSNAFDVSVRYAANTPVFALILPKFIAKNLKKCY